MSDLISIGDTGPKVATLQRLLNHHLSLPFAPIATDGVFGIKTQQRVIDFQTINREYPVNIPPSPNHESISRDPLDIDGIVGPETLRVLLDIRTLGGGSDLEPTTTPKNSFASANAFASPAFRLTNFNASPIVPVSDPQPQPPPIRTLRIIQVQAGTQASVNPWVFSPLVLTGQYTLLVKNDGRPDFLLTAGGQATLNTGSANGSWSGQGFLQMGLGGFDKLKFGKLDLGNPFVQIMIAKNQGQQFTAGGAIGNQVNYSLISSKVNGEDQDVLSVFFNGQAVVNVGLNDGKCSAPSGQFLIGGSISFF